MTYQQHSDDTLGAVMDRLSRCSWCGRAGTLTTLSAGNRCEMQDDCEQARHEAEARIGAMAAQPCRCSACEGEVRGEQRMTAYGTVALSPFDTPEPMPLRPESSGPR